LKRLIFILHITMLIGAAYLILWIT
jgi:hypothetical protein